MPLLTSDYKQTPVKLTNEGMAMFPRYVGRKAVRLDWTGSSKRRGKPLGAGMVRILIVDVGRIMSFHEEFWTEE